ncbi:unnamed protein product [Urochloa humidicola]
MDSKYRFPPCSHVEVFYDGSWWTGVILEVLDNKSTKKYLVKIKSEGTDMDDVECVDLLTVDHTQLRPKYNWYHGKWVRCLTKKRANRGPQLRPSGRPVSAAVASCGDSVELIATAPCNGIDEIRDEQNSHLKEKVNDEDLVLEQVCPDFLCNENDQMEYVPSSSPEEVVKQQSTVLSFNSHLTVPSQSLGFHSLKYDPKLCLSSQLELSSPRMITMPSVPLTGQLQASLFGAFGQLRPLPQGPIFGMQSHNIDFSSVVGSEKVFTDQGNQAKDKGGYLMSGSTHNINFGSFSGTDLPRKNLFSGPGKQANDKGRYLITCSKQNIDSVSFSGAGLSRKRLKSPQTAELLGGRPRIMQKRRRMSGKNENVKEASKLAAISEEPNELNNNNGKYLPKNVDPSSALLSEENTVTCTDSRPLKDNKGSEGIGVFLMESSVADDIIPSGVPIGPDQFHQENYVLIEKSVLSITSTSDNPSEAHVFPSDYSTQCENNAATAIIMGPGTSETTYQQPSIMDGDANVHLLPSGESCEDTGDKDSMEATVECVGSCAVPSMAGVASNLLPSSENCEDNNKDGMGNADQNENTCNMSDTVHASVDDDLSSAISLPPFKKFTDDEQHGVSQQDSSAIVEFAAEGSQSIENSEMTQLSSEAEQGDTFIDPKDSELTPMSKYVPSRTQGSCFSLLQKSLDVHKSIMADQPTESLVINNIPFMKTSPMWEYIEAMEVFCKVPQRPNFHQFQQHVPELREGMALGLMFSFASLAESIRNLSIHDEDALFEEKMEGLSLLEANGFDVRHLRSRLETLLHIRNCRAELQAAIKDSEKKISHKENDSRHLGAQTAVLNTTVRHLELQACLFRCKAQSVISQMMNDASEILRLKTEAGILEQSYLSAEQRFSSAAAAPW